MKTIFAWFIYFWTKFGRWTFFVLQFILIWKLWQLSPRFSGVTSSARESEAFGSNENTSTKNCLSFWPVDCSLRLCLRIWSFISPDSVMKNMVRRCIAYGCVNRSNKPESSKLLWHSLPINNAKFLRTWLRKMKRKDPPVSKHSYLCQFRCLVK